MSHIVTIQTEVRDPAAIINACQRMNLPEPADGTATLFTGQVTGWIVQLPGWKYPVVCDAENQKIHFDHFEGRWGDRQHLDQFLQMYSVEKARLEARKQGHTVTEEELTDGSIQLTIQLKAQA